ncbi:MAG: MBL fold metallo-hydrolase [Clostridia bacterium]|nr:MBL fold metallo-hydrolase [Clostridia bacterium]
MKFTKRLLCLLIALAACFVIVSCAKDGASDGTDSESTKATDTQADAPSTGGDTLDVSVPVVLGEAQYKSVYDAYDDTTMLYWSDASEADAKAYGDKLTQDGYAAYQTVDGSAIWSATYTKEQTVVHVYYTKALSEFRVLVSDNASLPAKSEEYVKVCDASVTQLGVDLASNSEGMGYIIQLEDGSFVVIDGGSQTNSDPSELYGKLKNLASSAGLEAITVRAWFITHADAEHYGVLNAFLGAYDSEIKVEVFVTNDASDEVYKSVGAFAGGFSFSRLEGTFGGAKYIKAHTGQSFSFAGVSMNILYTHEDANDMATDSLHSKTAMVLDATVEETRFLWLGDIESDGAARLVSMYGEGLKCDVLQISAGESMGSEELYKRCAPSTVFYAGTAASVEKCAELASIKYLAGTAERTVLACEGTYTMRFSDIIDIGKGTGSVDADSRYTEDY